MGNQMENLKMKWTLGVKSSSQLGVAAGTKLSEA